MSSQKAWTKEETDFVFALNNKGVHVFEIVPEFGTRFGYSRSLDSIGARLRRQGAEMAAPKSTPPVIQRERASPAFKPRQSTLENFVRHDADIKAMFRRADLKDGHIFKLVVQSDTHIPYHDRPALKAFNKFLDWYKPHGLINIGDFWEAESVSHWPARNTMPRRMVPEIKACRKELDETEAAAGAQCLFKRFFIGNHCAWLDQYFASKVPEVIDGLEELGLDLSVKKLLQLKERGYRIIPENEILRIGQAHFIHGYYTNQYHAKKHLDIFGVNIIYGHTHDVQSFTNVTVGGRLQAQSIGCLRDLNARFLMGKPNKWNHAFAIVEFQYNGEYTMLVPVMMNAKFSFGGILFDGNT